MSFIQQLQAAWQSSDSLLCIGLDPDLERFPQAVASGNDSIFSFNRAIIDATHDLVCAYKPQIAYFSALGAERQLEQTITYIKSTYPHIPVILDAKRGDIGSTAVQYAREAFVRYQVDAVTVNPYMGFDSVQPFLEYQDKGVIILCKTSNSGAAQLQEVELQAQAQEVQAQQSGQKGEPVYEYIARLVAEKWNFNHNCLLVMGATWPQQVARVRSIVGDMPFLVPGAGAQGGDIASIVQAGQTAQGNGLIISASRSILYASAKHDFAEAARTQAAALKNAINQHRTKHAAAL
ncbi:orotidine-5'-phosphate decarboxylase [Methylophilus luteus]|uniref:Orotidine 5'-phosphate decarboxylase n=1 Tax=Methylophilus luteus TaxID=640108 RepID=A0ABW3F260_9PROT